MARLYESGAELQSTTNGMEWKTTTSTGGGVAIDTTTKRSGSASIKFTSSASASNYIEHTYAAAGVVTFSRAYFYFTAWPTDTHGAIIQHINSTGTVIASVALTTAGKLRLYDGNIAGTQRGSDSSALSLNTWYRVEMTTNNGAGTEIDARINGTSFASGAMTSATNAMTIDYGFADFQASAVMYVDDIAVNDTSGSAETSWPGEGKLVLALPTAAGDNAGEVGTYSSVNEIPPSDSSTGSSNRIELQTNTSKVDLNVTDTSTLGIPSDATIKFVSVWGRIRETAAGASNYGFRIKSASGGTTTTQTRVDAGNATARTNPSSTTAFINRFVSYTDPTTSAAWTATGTNSLDNMQIGVDTTDGNPDVFVLWLGAYIEYNPVNVSQTEAAFYEDGTEAGSTVIDAGADSITRDVSSDSNILLRVRLQENNGAPGASTDDYQLQYEKNDNASWYNVDQTTTIDSYSESNQSTTLVIGGSGPSRYGVGQSVTGNGLPIGSVSFYISKSTGESGDMVAKLYAHSGTFGTSSVGTGSVLATSDIIDASTLTTSLALTTFTFSTPYVTTAGTYYVIILDFRGTASSGINIGVDNSSPTHGGNEVQLATDGTTFNAVSSRDVCLYLYSAVGTAVIGFNSTNLTDGNATTNRLGSGTGSFVAGEISEDGLVDNVQLTASNYTEHLYSLTLVSSALANNDTLDFRVLRNSAVIDTYTITPRITVSKSSDKSINVSDSITVTESVGRLLESYVNKSDSITITENIGRTLVSDVNVSDSITVTENAVADLLITINVSDSATITESTQEALTPLYISVSDSVTLTESITLLEESYVNVSDSITVTESTKLLLESYVNVSDSITVTENIGRLLESNVNVSDSATITENVSLLIPELFVTVSDNITVSESLKLLQESYISVSDTITITESVNKLLESYVNVSDSITVTESVNRLLESNVNVSDTTTVSETVNRVLESYVNVSDAVTITENVAVTIAAISDYSVNVSDMITVTESLTLLEVSFVNVSDSVTITENTKLLEESFVSATDNITVSESVTLLETSYINVSDTVAITESITVNIAAVGTDQITVSDSISISENVSLLITELFVTASDSITITESVSVSIQSASTNVITRSLLGVGV